MTDAYHLLRQSLHRGRRLTALALIALQGGIAASPLWEPASEGRLAAHTEQDGAQHKGLHNEATCVVCAVRTLHASAADKPVSLMAAQPLRLVATVAPHVMASRERVRTNLSRAPPVTG